MLGYLKKIITGLILLFLIIVGGYLVYNYNNSENWGKFHTDFTKTPSLIEKWKEKGFGYKETKDWIELGLSPKHFGYVTWFKHVKKMDVKQLLYNINKDDKQLWEEYQEWKKNNKR